MKRHTQIEMPELDKRFLMGIGNDKARIHIELNKDPKTIEEAVLEVITFMETTKYPQHDDEQYFNLENITINPAKLNCTCHILDGALSKMDTKKHTVLLIY
jgi:hypothetical protein